MYLKTNENFYKYKKEVEVRILNIIKSKKLK